jgi:hypothetical protein
LFKTTGDGFFVEFASAVQALRCAIAIQDMLGAQTDALRLRIGVHQGKVVPEGDDLFGDGVIASQLAWSHCTAARLGRPRLASSCRRHPRARGKKCRCRRALRARHAPASASPAHLLRPWQNSPPHRPPGCRPDDGLPRSYTELRCMKPTTAVSSAQSSPTDRRQYGASPLENSGLCPAAVRMAQKGRQEPLVQVGTN